MSHRGRKKASVPVTPVVLKSEPEMELEPKPEPKTSELTEMDQFLKMVERVHLQFKVTTNVNNFIIRIGGQDSFSLWTFGVNGELQGQQQYELTE